MICFLEYLLIGRIIISIQASELFIILLFRKFLFPDPDLVNFISILESHSSVTTIDVVIRIRQWKLFFATSTPQTYSWTTSRSMLDLTKWWCQNTRHSSRHAKREPITHTNTGRGQSILIALWWKRTRLYVAQSNFSSQLDGMWPKRCLSSQHTL